MPCIYKITNCVNGKCYVGQTKQSLKKRWGQHKAEGKSQRDHHQFQSLYRAMKKYGVDNFTIECLQECKEEELDELEVYWIGRLDTYRNGYNMTIGGSYKLTPPREYAKDPRKPVVQYTMNGEFVARYNSVKEAGEANGIPDTRISACCKHKAKSTYGFIFCYEGDTEYIEQIKQIKKRRTSKNSYTVQQFSLDGELIAEYISANEAGRKVGISPSNIASCCRGEYKTSHGYIWKYKF